MDNGVQVFGFEGADVRTMLLEGEPWFVLKDVCAVLGLSDSRRVAERLDEDEKLMELDSMSLDLGQRGGWLISESGLYTVILRSDKPEARRFRKWVTSEVLPALRKTGGYLSPAVDWTDPDKIIKLVEAWKVDRDARLEAEARVNRLIHIGRTYTTTELAKELNFKSAQELNQKLSEMGIVYKDHRGVWLLYSEYAAKGFQSIKQAERNGTTIYYASWTGIGRDWLLGQFSHANQEEV